MGKFLPFIKSTIAVLENKNLLTTLEKVQAFHDEPPLFSYSSSLDITQEKKYSDGRMYEIVGGGFSFTSREEALSKCLGELLERASMYSFPKEKLYFKDYDKIKQNKIDLKFFPRINSTSTLPSGWTKGFEVTSSGSIPCYLPAQSVYLPYIREYEETLLTEPNSNGAAGGFIHEQILLNSIYELVERDAFMSVFLGKIPTIKIDLSSITFPKIKRIVANAQNYYLDLHLFDITSDLDIPTFLTLLTDHTGYGPALAVGLGTNLNREFAILSSMQEAFASRQWTRHHMILRAKESNSITIHTQYVVTSVDRALLWSSPSMLHHMSFLLDLQTQPGNLSSQKVDLKNELNYVLAKLLNKNLQIFYTDATIDFIELCGYKVYKTLIPNLQPFHLNEYNKEIRLDRITSVASKYNFKVGTINTVPHPML